MMNYGYMCASGDGIRKNLDDGLFWLLSAIENGEDGAMEYLTKYYKHNRRGDWVKNCFHSILRDTLCLLKIIKGGLCSIGDLV